MKTALAGRPAPHLSQRLRRYAPLLLGALLLSMTAGTWGYLILHVIDYWDGVSLDLREDFVAFYAAAKLVGTGFAQSIYQPDAVAHVEEAVLGRPAGRGGGLAYMNPPFVAGMFLPFARLPYGEAQAVWFAVSALTIAASIALLWPELRRQGRPWAVVFGLAALTSLPVFWSLLYGQLTPIVLLSWVLFYRLSSSGREGTAGFVLAAAWIKPQLAFVPLLFLIATGRWRALAGHGAGGALLLVASTVLAGANTTFVQYPAFLLRSLQWTQEFGVNRLNMVGWSSFFLRLMPEAPTAARILSTALCVATLLAAVVVWRQRRRLDAGSAPTIALAIAAVLTSPHVHTHDLAVVLLPAALIVAHRRDALAYAAPALLFFAIPAATFGPNVITPLLAAVLAVVLANALGLLSAPAWLPGKLAMLGIEVPVRARAA